MEEIRTDGKDPINYFCLICCNEIDHRTRKKGLQSANILDDIFFVLSNYMKWNETGQQFQFDLELFPFCDNCTPTVQSVYELNEQVHNLLRRIDQLCANVSGKILLSQNKCERILRFRNSEVRKPTTDVNEEEKFGSESCHFDVEKVCSYRNVILRRFTTSVRLSALLKPESEEENTNDYWTGGEQDAKRKFFEAEIPSELSEKFWESSVSVNKDFVDNAADPDYASGSGRDEKELDQDQDLEDEAVDMYLKNSGSFEKEESFPCDENDAGALNLPLSSDDIVNLPWEELRKHLSQYSPTESQLSIIRTIRRRGKNKVAAQSSRKRKMNHILKVAEELQRIRDQKMTLMRDQENLVERRNEIREKYFQLYRIVIQALRDPDGNPYSPHIWSLEQATDGNFILLARTNQPPPSDTSAFMDSSIRLSDASNVTMQ